MVFDPRYIVQAKVISPDRLQAVSPWQTTTNQIVSWVSGKFKVLSRAIDDQWLRRLVVPWVLGKIKDNLGGTVRGMAIDVK